MHFLILANDSSAALHLQRGNVELSSSCWIYAQFHENVKTVKF